jgi:hypothetical protein
MVIEAGVERSVRTEDAKMRFFDFSLAAKFG